MAWFNRKKGEKSLETQPLSELPDLPRFETRALPETPPVKNELPLLPSFPANPDADKISQEAIKSSMEENIGGNVRPFTHEIDSTTGGVKQDALLSAREGPRRAFEIAKPSSLERKKDIFVRVDKFQEAMKNFEEVKHQLSKIEDYLIDLKQIKAREDTELNSWEKEILELKTKIAAIDHNIFSKIE